MPIGVLTLPVRYSIERIKPFINTNRQPDWVKRLKEHKFSKNEKVVIFGYNAPIEAMFYTNAIVYEHIPHILTIDSLQQKGYHVLINKNNPAYPQIASHNFKEIDLINP